METKPIVKEIKQYIVLTKEGEHDYNLEVEIRDKGEKYSIFASNNDSWKPETKNKLLLSLEDDGNGLLLNKNLKKMEYYDGTYLLILLKLRNLLDEYDENGFKIIETKEILTL